MKKILFTTSISLCCIVFMTSCEKPEIDTEQSIVGKYEIVVNPLLCSLPTIENLNIEASGLGYRLSFTNRFSMKNEKVTGVKMKNINGDQKIILRSKEIGQFTHKEYMDYSSGESLEGMVLMLSFDIDDDHYEFLGRK